MISNSFAAIPVKEETRKKILPLQKKWN